jgi:hypothetical protein
MNEASRTQKKNTLRWRLTGKPGAWKWELLDTAGADNPGLLLGSIKLGPRGYGWYIVSTGRHGILVGKLGERFDKLSLAAKLLFGYWKREAWRPEEAKAEEVA